MSEFMNDVVIVITLLVSLIFVYITIRKQVNQDVIDQIQKRHEQFEIDYLVESIKEMMFQLTSKHFVGFSESSEVYKRELNKRVHLKKALKGCANGSTEDKTYIIHLIGDLLKEHFLNESEIDFVLHFKRPGFLSVKDKFDMLLFKYKKLYDKAALSKIIEDEEWHIAKKVEGETLPVFCVSKEDVEEAFYRNQIVFTFDEKIENISQRIYENYKGFGVVDQIRDMDIDGVSGGVSGVTDFEMMERFAFYERTKKAFAVVATSESALYGNIILKKGVIKL